MNSPILKFHQCFPERRHWKLSIEAAKRWRRQIFWSLFRGGGGPMQWTMGKRAALCFAYWGNSRQNLAREIDGLRIQMRTQRGPRDRPQTKISSETVFSNIPYKEAFWGKVDLGCFPLSKVRPPIVRSWPQSKFWIPSCILAEKYIPKQEKDMIWVVGPPPPLLFGVNYETVQIQCSLRSLLTGTRWSTLCCLHCPRTVSSKEEVEKWIAVIALVSWFSRQQIFLIATVCFKRRWGQISRFQHLDNCCKSISCLQHNDWHT